MNIIMTLVLNAILRCPQSTSLWGCYGCAENDVKLPGNQGKHYQISVLVTEELVSPYNMFH